MHEKVSHDSSSDTGEHPQECSLHRTDLEGESLLCAGDREYSQTRRVKH
jgi:hypothetical protein